MKMIEIDTIELLKYKAKTRVWVKDPSKKGGGYHRMQETGVDVKVGPKDWAPTAEEIEDQAYGFPVKVPSNPKTEWRDKPEGYFRCDKAVPLDVKYSSTTTSEAYVPQGSGDPSIYLGKKFFDQSRAEQEYIMAHETGHTFEDQIPNMEEELSTGCAAKVLGTMILRPGKSPYYDGVWGEMNPSEAFADCVAALHQKPKEFKDRYPEAYDFVVSVMPKNWKEVIKTNIASIDKIKKQI